MDQVQKVEILLSLFQASLYSHLISVSSNRGNSSTYIGLIPDIEYAEVVNDESLNESKLASEVIKDPSIKEIPDDAYKIPSVRISIPKHGKALKKTITVKNDLAGPLAQCKGKKKLQTVVQDIELEYEEKGQVLEQNKYKTTPKVLQRLLSSTDDAKPARFVIPENSHENISLPSLYGEVIATTYSQGGDGFALHPGDFVSILQFLHEFGLVECKWQGLKGLFPQDKIKLLTRPSDSLNTSISSIVSKQLTSSKTASEPFSLNKSSKLINRLMKKPNFS
jgi:hypothetical protein